jgi:ATP phosphoribosyltransferase
VIRVALPSKGRLAEATTTLLVDCGYRVTRSGLSARDRDADIEWYFLRPKDIPSYLASGSVDAGVTGADLVAEAGRDELVAAVDLGFGSSRLCVAVPAESPYTDLAQLEGLTVATSFPYLTERHFGAAGVDVRTVVLQGSVEIAIALGVADVIVDLVDSGETLRRTGLRVLGEPIVASTATLFVPPGRVDDDAVAGLVRRLRGRVVAQQYVLVEYDVPADLLEAACELTPGIASPTISQLRRDGWFAVKAMTPARDAHRIMDALADLGCQGVIMTRIQASRQ